MPPLSARMSTVTLNTISAKDIMPVLPHNFPTLRRRGIGNHRPSVLILGAGMSTGLVPLPGQLLKEKRVKAEASLGCTSTVPLDPNPAADHLYQWAEDIWNALVARGDPNPKLTLAEALDIPRENRWHCCISTQRSTPRHRVVARFAREGLWHQIWSLNWDCVQESALENVGIKHRGADGQMPWPTVFNTLVTAAECVRMSETNSIKVIKPHGCVRALVEAQQAKTAGNVPRSIDLSRRFLITKTELDSLDPEVANDPTQQFIFAALLTSLSSHPFIVAGWSVSEKYLLDRIDSDVRPFLQNPDRETPLAVDELSIISRTFNRPSYTLLASFYRMNENTAHINVGQPEFDIDQLFLWLQTLYAIGFLTQRALSVDRPALDELTAETEQPPTGPDFTISWVDNFLPVWVRLCWRIGLVACENRCMEQVAIEDIALESRDEHIPWSLPNIRRPELTAASRILAVLHRSGSGSNWNYEQFPGGFYRDFHLVIPIPIWASDPPNDLRGLKPLIDAIKQHGDSYIVELSLVFVGPDPAKLISDDTKRTCKQLVANYLSLARFANADDIKAIRLEDL
jgi:hypothetical protein